MKHTPIGYDIVDGKAVINKEEAEQVKTLFAGYLLGLSLQAAASMAGLKGVNTSQAKRMLHNRKYLGDDYYPQLIDEETLNAAEEERQRKSSAETSFRKRSVSFITPVHDLPLIRYRRSTRIP